MQMRLEMKDRGMSVYVHCDNSHMDVSTSNILNRIRSLLDDLSLFDNVTINIKKAGVGKYSTVPLGPRGSYDYSLTPGVNGPGPIYSVSTGVDIGYSGIVSGMGGSIGAVGMAGDSGAGHSKQGSLF